MTDRKLYLGPITDSRRWDMVTLRPDDVIVVTPAKCGTTWMQTIVALLLSGDPDVETNVTVNMPWVDIRFREMSDVAARLEAMIHRRSMKSHTPMDGLPLDDHAHYFCVLRHPLDAHFSYRKHLANIPISFFDHWYPEDDTDGVTFRRFLDGGAEGFDGDAMTLAHIVRHYQTAAALAERPNVTLFHYADMTHDLPGTFAKIAALLGVSYPDAVMAQLIETASFNHMRSNAHRYAPSAGTGFMKSETDFFHSGTSGKWVGKLSDAELQAYDKVMDATLTPQERAWLEFGAAGLQQMP